MVNGSTPFERLRGLNTHAEDFHCMMNFISLIFAKFCDTTSTNDVGTSYQLRNKVDRRADVWERYEKPVSCFQYLFNDVLDGYLVPCAVTHFGMVCHQELRLNGFVIRLSTRYIVQWAQS